jgi:hypothetical protein
MEYAEQVIAYAVRQANTEGEWQQLVEDEFEALTWDEMAELVYEDALNLKPVETPDGRVISIGAALLEFAPHWVRGELWTHIEQSLEARLEAKAEDARRRGPEWD